MRSGCTGARSLDRRAAATVAKGGRLTQAAGHVRGRVADQTRPGICLGLRAFASPSRPPESFPMNAPSNRRRLFLILAVIAIAWAITALWFVPWIIRKAYAGESLAILNAMISGQAQTSVDQYLAMWKRLAWRLTLIGPIALLAIALVVRQLRRVRREHLVALVNVPPVSPRAALWHAVLIGILGGLAEAVNGIVRHRMQHLPTGEVVSGELIWMAPLAATVSLTMVTLVLIGIGYAIRRPSAVVRIAPPLCAGLATFGLLRAMNVGIATLAAVLVGAGVATMVVRSLSSNPQGLERFARRTTPFLAGARILWALALPLWR